MNFLVNYLISRFLFLPEQGLEGTGLHPLLNADLML